MLNLKAPRETLLFKETHDVERELNTHPSPSFRRPLSYLKTTTKLVELLQVPLSCRNGGELPSSANGSFLLFLLYYLTTGEKRKHTEPSARTLRRDGEHNELGDGGGGRNRTGVT